MALRYEEVELLEADGDAQGDAQRSCKKGRTVGIVVAMLAVVGLVGVASLPHNQFTATQHLSVARKALLKAFSPRSLAEAAKLKSSIAFTVHQDDVPLETAMKIKATVSADEAAPEQQQVEIDIAAVEGKGEELKKALLELASAVQSTMGPPPDQQDPPQEGEGRRLEDDMPFKVDVSDDDIVTFTIPVPEGPAQGELADSLQTKPTLSASVEFGRTLEQMCDNMGDKVPMVFNGVKVQMDASFAASMAKAAQTMEDSYGNPAMGKEVDMLQAFTKLSTNIELAYRDPSELGDLAEMFPPFEAAVGMLTQHVQQAPDEVKAAVKKLDGLSAGTRRIALRGLPEGYQIVVELSDFNVAPVLSKMIGDL